MGGNNKALVWRKIRQFSSKHKVSVAIVGGATFIVAGFAVFCAVSPPDKIGWTGFKRDTETSKSEKTVASDKETTITTKDVSGKTLWDWMSLILAPVTLTGLGLWFQFNQDRAKTSREEVDKKQAETSQREQALETYLDRISDILLSQQLLSLDTNNPKDKARLITALDVIRARTLTILQRLNIDKDNADGERKRSVLLFLYDAELIGKKSEQSSNSESNESSELETSHVNERLLQLNGADFSGANLFSIKLSGANLRGANFCNADLRHSQLDGANLIGVRFIHANLSGADLSGADLRHAKLRYADFGSTVLFSNMPAFNANVIVNGTSFWNADLRYTDLNHTNLLGVNLLGTNLSGADLQNAQNLTESQLTSAKLCNTKLPPGIPLDPKRNCEESKSDL